MAPILRAGVIGASGIGKHHVKWLQALGCEVVAFAGTSQASVDATGRVLADLCGFRGEGYVDTEAMLAGARLDLVSICSPPWLHQRHFLAAAGQGCHVLCEKPLVWDPDKPVAQVLDEAGQMVAAAHRAGIIAAVNTQYVAAVAPYRALCARAQRPVDLDHFSRFMMRMDSRGGKPGAGGERIWIDLASHPLSVLMALAGPGDLVPGSETCRVADTEVHGALRYQTANGRTVAAEIVVGNVPAGPLVRRFGVDGELADYEGRNDETGVFAAYLTLGEHELKATDFMRTSIERFVSAIRGAGSPLCPIADGFTNLQIQLGLLMAGRARGTEP